jgi:hypothetical protein
MNVYLLGANLLFLISCYLVWFIYCKNGYCSFEFRNGVLDPLASGLFILTFSLIALTFFSEQISKQWLKYIASWYIPVSIFFISQISVHSSFILSIDRATAAVYWMSGLFILTCAFVGYHLYIAKK